MSATVSALRSKSRHESRSTCGAKPKAKGGSRRFTPYMRRGQDDSYPVSLLQSRRIPLYNGTLISDDGKALALFLPLTRKDLSYRVYTDLREKIATFEGEEEV